MKSVLLENIEYLKKINPWKVNIIDEINLVYDILKEDLNLVIAGIAADNASFIYNRKIESIESIYKRKDYAGRRVMEEINVPRINIKYAPGKSLVDISDIVDSIYDIIEKRIKAYRERDENITIDFEPYSNIEEEISATKKEILNKISRMSYPILFSDLIEIFHKKYSPLKILYAILFLYMDDEIDFDILENQEGIAIDLIIKPTE